MGSLRHAFVVVVVLAIRAHADTNIEEADKLFAKGLELRETNLQQSCEAFQKSLELNPQAIGTLLNVALCDEKFGRIASAVQHYSEAKDRAKEGNLPDYIKEADTHIDALKGDLPYVRIKFLTGKLGGTKVLIGDRVIPDGKLDEKFAVDPGELVVVVSAPDHLAFETRLMIGKKEEKQIDVPELRKGSVTVKSSKRTLGIITTIAGGTMFVTGEALGWYANRLYDQQFRGTDPCSHEPGQDVCPPSRQSKTDRARTIGTVGTVIGAIGLVGVGVGVFLWIRAPKETSEKKISIIPTVTPDHAGVAAIGRF